MNKIMDFLNATATAHADEKIVMTEGYYEDYYTSGWRDRLAHCDTSVRSIRHIWDGMDVCNEELPTTLRYRFDGKYGRGTFVYSDEPTEDQYHRNPNIKLISTWNLPPSGSWQALEMLIQFCNLRYNAEMENGCCALESVTELLSIARVRQN